MKRILSARFRVLLSAIVGVLGWLCLSGLAFAAEGHGGEDPTAPTPIPWNDVIEAIVNFTIFIWLLVYFTKKPVKRWLEKRSRTIASQLEEAGELRRQAEAKLEEYQTKLDKFDQEREEVLAGYAREAEKERQAILKEARRQVERLRADAKVAIEYEVKHAQSELRRRIVDEAVAIAREAIIERLDADARKRLFEEYTEALSQMKGQGPA